MNGVQAWMQNLAMAKEIKQDAVNDPADVANFDAINKRVAEILNVPEDCINDEGIVSGVRKTRAKQAQLAQQAEMIERGAGAVQKLGNTPITEDRLLAPLARAATGLGGGQE